jgi:hypothetical protein
MRRSTLDLSGPLHFTVCVLPCSCTLSVNLNFVSFASTLWISSRLGRGKNTQAGKSNSMKSAPKRLRTCFDCKNQFGHLRGLLPAWSARNGFSWLLGGNYSNLHQQRNRRMWKLLCSVNFFGSPAKLRSFKRGCRSSPSFRRLAWLGFQTGFTA